MNKKALNLEGSLELFVNPKTSGKWSTATCICTRGSHLPYRGEILVHRLLENSHQSLELDLCRSQGMSWCRSASRSERGVEGVCEDMRAQHWLAGCRTAVLGSGGGFVWGCLVFLGVLHMCFFKLNFKFYFSLSEFFAAY